MKILYNASTIMIGGGIQNSLSTLIEGLLDDAGHEWHFALSERVAAELRHRFPAEADRAHVFVDTPALNRSARARLESIERDLKPDCVFTYNGPAYARFRAPHLLGFATPWVTHPSLIAYRTLNFPFGWVTKSLSSRYKAYWYQFADAWVTESMPSKRGLERRLGLDPSKVFVVPNSCGPGYFAEQTERPFPSAGSLIRLLSFSAAYPHKRLEWMPFVARALEQRFPQLNFEFVVTLPEDNPTYKKLSANAAKLGVASRFKNIGRVAVADGPKLYRSCDICFMPTVLETFSATYPEAMAMGVPIVTSNLDFASDVCRDAALYFKPNDAASAADCIGRLVADERLWKSLIAKGKEVLTGLPTPRDKYDAYMRILCETAQPRRAEAPALNAT